MSEIKLPRLLAVAKEFNVGQDTIVAALARRGFNKDVLTATTKLTEDMYHALQAEFQRDKQVKGKADLVEIPKDKKFSRHFQTLAASLVYKCLEENQTVLELGNCGLMDEDFEVGSELDTLLRKCTHLDDLILSNKWSISGTNFFKRSLNSEKPNRLYKLPPFLLSLTQLKTIICAGDEIKNWGIRNLNFISNFKSLHYLDLSYNKIVEISKLTEVYNLKILNLRFNQIKEVVSLDWLQNIEMLLLGNNSIANNYALGNLHQLKHLELKNNSIEKITALDKLISLEILDLTGNQIFNIDELNDIDKLSTLDLSFNKISKITGLSGLMDLTKLNLSGNNLNYIEGLEELTSLEILNISLNHISEIEGLNQLPKLESLYLSNNNISEIRGLENLSFLRIVNLNYNQISNISGLVNLKMLTHLELEGNQVDDISQILHLEKLEIVNLNDNPVLEDIPEEVIHVGWRAIRDRLLAGDLTPIKEVKLLLLGNTNVGKSNLLEYLETGKEPVGKESTHGIQYKILDKFIKGINIHCWDFGGQEYFHATHQLFFSPGALHIVLWSKNEVQRENVEERHFGLGYWIRCIEQLISNDGANKIEVVVLENKIDNNKYLATNLNQLEFANKYPNLNFHFTSCSLKPLKRTKGVKELIEERIENLCNTYQYSYVKHLKKIKTFHKPVIEVSEIPTKNIEELIRAIQVFHNMGILLYYPNIIPDKIFIQPQVLLNLLYQQILDKDKREQITIGQIEEFITNNILQLTSIEVIELLKYFNLVFQIPDVKDKYFVPQYLKMPPALIDFFEKYQFQKANICIKSDNYLMNLAMLKVFSEYGKYVKGKQTKEYLFWKDGIVIEKNNVLLMVKFNREKQSIELFPDLYNSNFELQKELVAFILDTCKIEPKLSLNADETWKEYWREVWDNPSFSVWISLDGEYFTEWNRLKENREKGIFQIEASKFNIESGTTVRTLSIFDYNKYLPQNEQGQMKKIFISYSKDDLRLVNKFIEHLSALKLDGKVENWYCTELLAGKDWDYEIQKHFDEADIVCFMISPNFMRTKYIHEHEIKKAFERKEKNSDFKIVPIILDFCRWTTRINNLGDFTALPYTAKPVVDFINQNMAWYIIEECLRLMIDYDIDPRGDDLFRTHIDLPKDVKEIFERIVENKLDNNAR